MSAPNFSVDFGVQSGLAMAVVKGKVEVWDAYGWARVSMDPWQAQELLELLPRAIAHAKVESEASS